MLNRPPFRADHVGSLLRPAELLSARADRAAGRIDERRLGELEDDAIRELVREQEGVGLRTATDGEFRRSAWHMDFVHQLGGTAPSDKLHSSTWQTPDGVQTTERRGLVVSDRIALERPIFAEAFTFLRDTVTTSTAKLTIPSPNVVAELVGATADATVYEDDECLWDDLTAAYREQVAGLARLGCRYLQLDDTTLAHLNDPAYRDRVEASGGAPVRLRDAYVANFNRAIEDRPEEMAITTHLCRGNFRSMWRSSGGYDYVAEAMFAGLDVDGFFLEFDDERSGGFEVLRFVPPGKRVVLGLVTTKRPALEDRERLLRRVEAASRHLDVDQLCISPQCGFASTEEGNALSPADQMAKLELVVEVAGEIWGTS